MRKSEDDKAFQLVVAVEAVLVDELGKAKVSATAMMDMPMKPVR
jgi:hypothetical protein